MTTQAQLRTAIQQAQKQADRTMGDIRTMLVPTPLTDASAEHLAAAIGQQLAQATPDQRRLISDKAALAIAELAELQDILRRQLAEISTEMGKIRGHRMAVGAYAARRPAAAPRHEH